MRDDRVVECNEIVRGLGGGGRGEGGEGRGGEGWGEGGEGRWEGGEGWDIRQGWGAEILLAQG